MASWIESSRRDWELSVSPCAPGRPRVALPAIRDTSVQTASASSRAVRGSSSSLTLAANCCSRGRRFLRNDSTSEALEQRSLPLRAGPKALSHLSIAQAAWLVSEQRLKMNSAIVGRLRAKVMLGVFGVWQCLTGYMASCGCAPFHVRGDGIVCLLWRFPG